MRKLASIQKIINIEPIPNADNIEKATVLGWECVVQKGEFKVGDLCIYIEYDSILPDHPIFEFMRSRKFKVKTIKLKKQISQGLIMPVSILSNFTKKKNLSLEDDVTDIIGIKKHDPEAEQEFKSNRKERKQSRINEYLLQFYWFRKLCYFFGKERLGNFPWFISKTDETRIQAMPHLFKAWNGKLCYATEKLDGSSTTFAIYNKHKNRFIKWLRQDPKYSMLVGNSFYVCSRNIRLTRSNKNNNFWKIAEQEYIETKLRSVDKNIAIQGEIIGEGIQGNKYSLSKLQLYIFNVFDIDNNRYLTLDEKLAFCDRYEFNHVPSVDKKFIISDTMTVNSMVEKSKERSLVYKRIPMEGIVIRQLNNDHASFKAINPEFLLKYNL
jgi:hypothetical protein